MIAKIARAFEDEGFTAPADELMPEEATGGDSHTW